jgi:hypothetical protein
MYSLTLQQAKFPDADPRAIPAGAQDCLSNPSSVLVVHQNIDCMVRYHANDTSTVPRLFYCDN